MVRYAKSLSLSAVQFFAHLFASDANLRRAVSQTLHKKHHKSSAASDGAKRSSKQSTILPPFELVIWLESARLENDMRCVLLRNFHQWLPHSNFCFRVSVGERESVVPILSPFFSQDQQ